MPTSQMRKLRLQERSSLTHGPALGAEPGLRQPPCLQWALLPIPPRASLRTCTQGTWASEVSARETETDTQRGQLPGHPRWHTAGNYWSATSSLSTSPGLVARPGMHPKQMDLP